MRSELITHADAQRVPDFDALFIRDTTNVNHYTYRIARAAAVDDMVVMDEADSILRCGNKVFLHELLRRHRLPTPKTMLVHRSNLEQVIPALGLPCILKQPDGAFSLGVVKVESAENIPPGPQPIYPDTDSINRQE